MNFRLPRDFGATGWTEDSCMGCSYLVFVNYDQEREVTRMTGLPSMIYRMVFLASALALFVPQSRFRQKLFSSVFPIGIIFEDLLARLPK
jgi:hypothetical protein